MRTLSERWIPLAGLAVLLITAWLSTGFQSADEHYQVIAFAEARAGHQPLASLPWEYEAQIRSALLPSVAMAVFGALRGLGIHDPFVLAFFLRLITALLAFAAVLRFVKATRSMIAPGFQRWYLLLSFFLWFLPFLHVRFTGETWSGIFLMLALAPWFGETTQRSSFLRSGLFLGLAFLCRPPILAAAAGIVAWAVLVKHAGVRNLFALATAFASVLLAGIALDSWFYGQFTITAWRYFKLGIAGSPGHDFAAFPWWYYYAWVLKYAVPMIGAAILVAFGLLCANKPRHLITWTIVPFLVLHMAVPHKELRFLFPLADLAPIMLVLGAQILKERRAARWQHLVRGQLLAVVTSLLVATNLIALFTACTTPAGTGIARLARYAYKLPDHPEVRINYLSNQVDVWRIRVPAFYLPPNASDTVVGSPCPPAAPARGKASLLVAQGPLPPCTDGTGQHWTPVESAQPPWKEWLLHVYDMEDAKPAWKMYEARASLPAPAK